MMPAAARPVWAEALFECLSVAMSMIELEWARCVRERGRSVGVARGVEERASWMARTPSPSPTPTPTLTVSRNDLNMLVKTAHDRRQNFTDDQASAILHWNRRRKSGTDDLKKLFS